MMATLRDKLCSGASVIGAWLTVPSPQIAEVLASCGFDWLCVDLEHSPVDETAALLSFIAAERHNVAPIVRLPSADPYLARRMLDSGAHGLIIPVVEDVVTFTDFASCCLYPPKGRRGTGLSRACFWGDTFTEYTTGFEPLLVPQIETMKGVGNAEAIAALEVVDAIFLGPYDLSADLGQPGNFETDTFIKAITTVKAACEKHGVAPGYHQVAPDMAALTARMAEGYRLLAFGTDALAIRSTFSGVATMDRAAG